MRCRNCQADIPDDAAFCPKCGTRQAAGAALETIDQMIEDYRRRLNTKPDDADARFQLALAYKHKKLDDLAIAELEQLRQQGVEFADLECELAALYLRQGRRDDAAEAVRRALALEADHRAAKQLIQRIGEGKDG
ncbi:MAG: zinc-ribbon domain-containing protein [Armatimonadota bacterium]|nr:MAG: zinc-ribbon domain-containing protein [Armatimonadota bacterium]